MKGRVHVGVLSIFLVFGILTFAVALGVTFSGSSVFEYSTPLSVVWCGLGAVWLSALLLAWHLLFGERQTKFGHVFSVCVCFGFAVCGFANMISFAASPNEPGAACMSVLWIALGVYGAIASIFWLKNREKLQPFEGDETNYDEHGHFGRCNCSCCSCVSCRPCCTSCCTGRNWMVVFGMFLLIWLGVFAIGFTVQAGMAAAEFSAYPPPGRIYSVPAGSVTLRMHMFCQGAGNATVIFEHGGGASGLSGEGLMIQLRQYGLRTCQYDRVGYGWTPSLWQRSSPSPTSGDILSNLLEVANEGLSGPIVCVGHSAGAAACLQFAIAAASKPALFRLSGVVMLDGYPDLVRAGSYPGGTQAISTILESLRGYAVMFGPTGLSRGMLGSVPPSFSPASAAPSIIALYHQTRFWLSQYFDVASDTGPTICSRLGGSGCPDARGVFNYTTSSGAAAFPSLRVLHIAASAIIQDLACTPNSTDYCCGVFGFNTTTCQNRRTAARLYELQIPMYLTLGTSGRVSFAPAGSDHSFVSDRRFIPWTAQTIVDVMFS